jgi:hypothetical protein
LPILRPERFDLVINFSPLSVFGLDYSWHAAFAAVGVEGNLSILNCGVFLHLTRSWCE